MWTANYGLPDSEACVILRVAGVGTFGKWTHRENLEWPQECSGQSDSVHRLAKRLLSAGDVFSLLQRTEGASAASDTERGSGNREDR